MKTNKELFADWLSEIVSSSRVPACLSAMDLIQEIGHKKHVFQGNIYDIKDPEISRKLFYTILEDGYLSLMHSESKRTVKDVATLFHKYISEKNPASEKEKAVKVDTPAEQVVRRERTYVHEDVEEFYSWLSRNDSLSATECKSLVSALRVAELFAQENISEGLALFSDDPDVVNKTIDLLSQDPNFKRKNDERKGRYFIALGILRAFNNSKESKGNMPAASKVAEGQEQMEDPLLALVISKGIEYIDNRGKGGRLWLIGDLSLRDKILEIQEKGYRSFYIERGCKTTGFRSAWYVDVKPGSMYKKTKAKASGDERKKKEASKLQKPAVEKTAEKKQKKDVLIELLKSKGLKFIDDRTNGGPVWLIGGLELQDVIRNLRDEGYSFYYSVAGTAATEYQSGWFLVEKSSGSKTGSKPEVGKKEAAKKQGKSAAASVAAGQGKAIKPQVAEQAKQAAPAKVMSPNLCKLLADDDMAELREELARQGVITMDQFKTVSLWPFLNRYTNYSISKRQDIIKRINKRLCNPAPVDTSTQYCIKTTNARYYGNTPAEAFVSFCEYLAQKYPLKIRTLIGAQYNGQGSVVLYREDQKGNSPRLTNPVAYVNSDLTEQAAFHYGKWLSEMCGDKDYPVEVKKPRVIPQYNDVNRDAVKQSSAASKQKTEQRAGSVSSSAQKTKATGSAASAVASSDQGTQTVSKADITKVDRAVLKADLSGITVEKLSEKTQFSVAATRRIVAADPKIVQLGDKLVHENAFVDWEDGADKLEEILEKLLDRNDGYISAAKLYEYARSEMYMFLNDNDMDDEGSVYELARHLFEKVGYHGKKLVFQSKTHISRNEAAVTSVVDLIHNFAQPDGGFFRESELIEYLQSVGVKTGNLRGGLMKVYTEPSFLFYDEGVFLEAKCIRMDYAWFSEVKSALDNLFNDLGDHIVIRDIQPWWFYQLPGLPGGKQWTPVLLQSVLYFFGDKVGGARTIKGLSGQSGDTIHAMLVSKDSEIQTFPDAVVAVIVDEGIQQRDFETEELRQILIKRGMVAGNELLYTMPKALADDGRFAWDAAGQRVVVKV